MTDSEHILQTSLPVTKTFLYHISEYSGVEGPLLERIVAQLVPKLPTVS
jgi:hypothetical protein